MCVVTEDNTWCVYVHTNKINGKKYVGITSRKPESRWGYLGNHYRKQSVFGKAIQKYGWNNFEHEIVVDELSEEAAKNMERQLISDLHTCIFDDNSWGYNMTFGGDGTPGYHPTTEAKAKRSERMRGENNPWYGKTFTDEVRLHLSLIRKGQRTGEENSFFGRKHTEVTKAKLSQYASARTGEKNPNYGKHTLAGENHPWFGKHLPDETKKKISESRKGKYSGGNNSNAKPVYCYETDCVYATTKEAAQVLHINASAIGKLCKGIYGKDNIKGYHFRYASQEDI